MIAIHEENTSLNSRICKKKNDNLVLFSTLEHFTNFNTEDDTLENHGIPLVCAGIGSNYVAVEDTDSFGLMNPL